MQNSGYSKDFDPDSPGQTRTVGNYGHIYVINSIQTVLQILVLQIYLLYCYQIKKVIILFDTLFNTFNTLCVTLLNTLFKILLNILFSLFFNTLFNI